MSENSKFLIGVDIGGTHISAALVDQSNWQISSDNVVRNHVNSQSDAKSILQTWADSILSCKSLSPEPIFALGIAMPGPFDYDKGISMMFGQSKYDDLYKVNIKAPLAALTGISVENIHFINDAAAFLQGEVFAQQLHTKSAVLGITLGTGLGSAVWRRHEKAFDAALWNSPYQELIFEEFLVTRWFTKRFYELAGIEVKGLKEMILSYANHAAFAIICDEYGNNLLNFLAYFSEKYSSKDFIIGGNIAKALPYFMQGKEELFKEYHIQTATLGEEAAMVGAASLFR